MDTKSLSQKYFALFGRTSRKTFWLSLFIQLLFFIVCCPLIIKICESTKIISNMTINIIIYIFILLLYLFHIYISLRRWHDFGRSGCWVFLEFFCIICLVFINPKGLFGDILLLNWFFYFIICGILLTQFIIKGFVTGNKGDNCFGPDPFPDVMENTIWITNLFLRTFFVFNGRISRSTFWLAAIFPAAAFFCYFFCAEYFSRSLSPAISYILILMIIPFLLVTLYVQLPLGIKRWHDLNKSGWRVIFNLIFFVGLFGLVIIYYKFVNSFLLNDISNAFLTNIELFSTDLSAIFFGLYAFITNGFIKGAEGDNNFGFDPLYKK